MTLWTPTSTNLPSNGVEGWYFLRDATGVLADGAKTTQAASKVSQWSDASANGRHLTQPFSIQPAYSANGLSTGHPGLTTDGTDYLRSATGLGLATPILNVFVVLSRTDTGVNSRVFSVTASGNPDYNNVSWMAIEGDGSNIGTYHSGNSIVVAAPSATPLLIGAFASANTSTDQTTKLTLDGTVSSSTLTVARINGDQYSLLGGTGGGMVGTVAEILVVSGLLSDADRQTIEGYLAWNNGTQTSLPSGHPYASAAPTVSGGGGTDATGSGSYTEAADTAAGTGTRGAAGSGGATEGGDTGAGSGASGSSGSGAYTEPADTAAGSGNASSGFTGSGTYTEASDTAAGSGASGSTGSGASTEAGDTGAGSGTVTTPTTGSGGYTEAPDTGAGSGNASTAATGSGSYTEAGDTAVGYAPGLDPSKVAGGGAGYTLEDWAEAARQKRKRRKGKQSGELLEQIAEGRAAAAAHKAAVLAELAAPVNTELNTPPAEVAPVGPPVLQASDPVPAPEAAPMAIEISIKPELDELLVEIRADMQRAVHDIIGHFRLTTSSLSSEVRTLQRENAELRRHMAILSDDLETYQAFALAQAGGKVH